MSPGLKRLRDTILGVLFLIYAVVVLAGLIYLPMASIFETFVILSVIALGAGSIGFHQWLRLDTRRAEMAVRRQRVVWSSIPAS